MNKTTLNSQKEKHSMLSLRRATGGHAGASAACKISIHALLAESDCRCPIHEIIFQRISIHALLAESDHHHNRKDHPQQDFYPRSPCGERRKAISAIVSGRNFYPRSPCGERQKPVNLRNRLKAFLSTLSLRRATQLPLAAARAQANFYPRSPCGERHANIHVFCHCAQFLSTLSLRRATLICGGWRQCGWIFLSTLSLRRATVAQDVVQAVFAISIHALLAESDATTV